MSKNYPEKEVDVNAMDQEELTALANDDATTEPAPAKKRVFSRILALILALAPIALMCFMPITMFYAGNGTYLFGDKVTLLQVFMNIFKKNGVEEIYKLAEITSVTDFSSFKFHGVPLFNAAGNYGKVYSWFLYAFPVVFLLNIVFMLFGVFSGKKAPAMVRAIAFTDMLLFGGYALLILFLSAMPFNTGDKYLYDIPVVAIAGAGALFFAAYAIGKRKGKITLPLILLILTLAFAGVYVYAYFHYEMKDTFDAIYQADKKFIGSLAWGKALKYFVCGLVVLYALAILVSVIRLTAKKGYGFDIFRYALHLILALAMLYPCFFEIKEVIAKDALKDMKWFAVAAAGIALVQLIICIIAKAHIKAKANAASYEEEEEVSEPATESVQPAEETPAPAQPAYLAPVAQTAPVAAWMAEAQNAPAVQPDAAIQPEPAEEEQLVIPNFSSFGEDVEELKAAPAPAIVPVAETKETPAETTETAQTPSAAPAGYDYYNSKSFDPFIASLNDKEREQFTDLFILKYKGTMKNIPDYEVGGDNDEFFRKIFIYLGQYRDRIPDSLLAKMYKYCVRK